MEAPQRIGLKNAAEGAKVWNHLFDAHFGTVERFTGFGIKHSALQNVGLYGLRAENKAQQGQDAEDSASKTV